MITNICNSWYVIRNDERDGEGQITFPSPSSGCLVIIPVTKIYTWREGRKVVKTMGKSCPRKLMLRIVERFDFSVYDSIVLVLTLAYLMVKIMTI